MKNTISPYIENFYNPVRRKTLSVKVGTATIGGDAPVLVQSMTTTDTKDIQATAEQVLELVNAGCELVRITTPTVKDAQNLEPIMKIVREAGCDVPVSADIHFQPKAAYEAVKWVEKVRINPGNFVDKGVMHLKPITDEEFEAGTQKVKDAFTPLVRDAKKRGVALRIGTNHGSLSARMLFKYGDTVEGMVESALEYIRVCEEEDFDQVVFSMKASNPKIVVEAYRLLAQRLDSEHKPYPFHLGVTEAGEGEDGRIKSAVGIGALLKDGLGDTIRVSLTENPVEEIPVANKLIETCKLSNNQNIPESDWDIDYYHYDKRNTSETQLQGLSYGGNEKIKVGATFDAGDPVISGTDRATEWGLSPLAEIQKHSVPVFYKEVDNAFRIWNTGIQQEMPSIESNEVLWVQIHSLKDLESIHAEELPENTIWSCEGSSNRVGEYRYLANWLKQKERLDSIVLHADMQNTWDEKLGLAAAFGSLIIDGVGDLILVSAPNRMDGLNYSYDLLQAVGVRKTKTEFISCPSCGRTLFDLEEVTAMIKSRTGHLKNVSIAIMGCIVNGPGEMADADFGYVGGAPKKINLYVGKTVVQRNIPEDEACDALVQLIKEQGKWIEPESALATAQ